MGQTQHLRPHLEPAVLGTGLDVARRAGPNPPLFPAHFSEARVTTLNGQEGHCQLGNDVVANATWHLIAQFIFILLLAQCLVGSGPSTQPC